MAMVMDFASTVIATVKSILYPQSEGPAYGLGDAVAHDAGPSRPALRPVRAMSPAELAEKQFLSSLRHSIYDRAA